MTLKYNQNFLNVNCFAGFDRLTYASFKPNKNFDTQQVISKCIN